MVDGVDPIGHRARRLGPVGDDLGHGALRIAKVLRPAQDVVPGISLAGRLLLVDPEVANARQRAVEEGVEGVRQRSLMNHCRAGDRCQSGQTPVAIDGIEGDGLPIDGGLVQVDEGGGRCRARPARRDRLPGCLQGDGLVFREISEHRHQEGAGLLVGWFGRDGGALVLGGGGRILVQGDGDVTQHLEVERAARLQFEGRLVGGLRHAVVLGEEGDVAQLLTQAGVVGREGGGPLEEVGCRVQVLPGNRKASQFQQPFHPFRLGAGGQLEVIERLGVILLVAVVVAPVPFDLAAVVGRSLLGEVLAFGELLLRLVVAAHVRERFPVKGSGESRARRGLDGGGAVACGRREVVVPIFDARQDGEDEAVFWGELLRLEGFVERGLQFGLVVEDQRVGGMVLRVLRMSADEVLELGGGRGVFVLEHELERGLRARSGGLRDNRIASDEQGSSNKEYRAAPPHAPSLSRAY